MDADTVVTMTIGLLAGFSLGVGTIIFLAVAVAKAAGGRERTRD